MAYSTGTSTTLNDLYDSLVSFAQGCGWTLHDTVTARDKVLTSNGSDGKRDMVYRLTLDSEANCPVKAVSDYAKYFPSISVRGYHNWNAATHTGSNEYGWVGPMLHCSSYRASVEPDVIMRPKYDSTSANIKAEVDWFSTNYDWHSGWDGHRLMVDTISVTNTTKLRIQDVPFKNDYLSAADLGGALQVGGSCLVFDAATDKTYVYQVIATATDADTFQKYDVELDTWTRVANIPWADTPARSFCLWDGADYLYVFPAAQTFFRYTISTGVWLGLASASAARAWAGTGDDDAIYVPNSVTGLGQDVIYCTMAANTVLNRYDVTNNAWRGAGAGALVSPTSVLAGARLMWDRKQYCVYVDTAVQDAYYVCDLTAGPGAFSNMGVLSWEAIGAPSFFGVVLRDNLASVLKGNSSNDMTFHFVGDADQIVAAVKFTVASGDRWYWIYMGKYETVQRSDVMTVTAAATSGTRTTVAVDDSSLFFAGDYVQLFDPTTGNIELTTIYDVPDATSFRASSLVYNYTSGSRVGPDVNQTCLAGDTYFAGVPFGPQGYRTDTWHDHYQVQPALIDADTKARTNPSPRGPYIPIPLSIYSNTANLVNYETIGSLLKVGALEIGTYPKAQSGDILRLANKNYLLFKPATHMIHAEQHGILMGPLE